MPEFLTPATLSILGPLLGLWVISISALVFMLASRTGTPIQIAVAMGILGASSGGLILVFTRTLVV